MGTDIGGLFTSSPWIKLELTYPSEVCFPVHFPLHCLHLSILHTRDVPRVGQAEVDLAPAWTHPGHFIGVFIFLWVIQPAITASQALGEGAGVTPAHSKTSQPIREGAQRGE